MLTAIHPKLPMRDKKATRNFYSNKLGFQEFGIADYHGYLMMQKDGIQIHFFEFKTLDPNENYGQVYLRTDDIDTFYQTVLDNKTSIHPDSAYLHPDSADLQSVTDSADLQSVPTTTL